MKNKMLSEKTKDSQPNDRYMQYMALQDKHGHHVKRVTLPDGKVIDVVYFDEDLATNSEQWTSPALHICPSCQSDLVYPLDWEEIDEDCWAVEVRCPECEWVGNGLFDQGTVHAFDERLDEGMEQLVDDLHRLERANMENEIERFAKALAGDNILPEDF